MNEITSNLNLDLYMCCFRLFLLYYNCINDLVIVNLIFHVKI